MTALDFQGPIAGTPFAMIGALDLAADGYRSEEWFVSGTARSWTQRGDRTPDGCWDVAPGEDAEFTTRVVVVRPNDPGRFNGTLVVEWMNVSGGIDASPDWLFLHRHLIREGAAWVGVSAQKAGIDGGGLVPGRPLKEADAERYGRLVHPGDAFSYDLFGRIGAALRSGEFGGPLEDLTTQSLLGIGESQSAAFLVAYANAIDPVAPVYDGLMIHGRPAAAAGIDGRYMRAARDGNVSKVSSRLLRGERIREDLRIPVLTLQSETDLVALGSVAARQPDFDRFRLWEVAGAAHFDTYGLLATHEDDGKAPIEKLADGMAPTDRPMGMQAEQLVNSGPQQHYVAQAAVAHLDRWVREGTPPPTAPRLETRGEGPFEIVTDALGIAVGGLRTPWVEAPSAALSGLAPGGDGFLFLFGRTVPFDAETLARLYPGGPDEHLERFERATEAALEAGFLLAADADEIRALARYGRQPSGFRVA